MTVKNILAFTAKNWLFGAAMVALAATETILFVDRQMSPPHVEVHYQVRVNGDSDPIVEEVHLTPITRETGQ